MFDMKDRLNRLLEGDRQKSLLKRVEGETTEEKAQTFFNKVYGYGEIKNNLFRALLSEEQVNTLLVGSPAGGKSERCIPRFAHGSCHERINTCRDFSSIRYC